MMDETNLQPSKGKAGRIANRNSGDTRASLIASARLLFSRSRYEDVKVSDIVQGAGVSQGTFFYHFRDKETVLIEILEGFFRRARALAESWAETSDTSADTIAGFARSVAQLVFENQDLVRIMAGASVDRDRRVAELVRNFYDDLYSQATRAMELGIRLGVVRPCDARIAAVSQVGMIKEVISDQLEHKAGKDLDREHIVSELIGLIYLGIRPPTVKN